MRYEDVEPHVRGIPYTSSERGRFLYDFVRTRGLRRGLELGFAHGTSTCYLAAAFDEAGGRLTAVDLEVSRDLTPSLETLLGRTALSRVVDVHRERTSYTWWLKKEIEARTKASKTPEDGGCEAGYDFCFIDGPKSWTIDGCAFFLVDKLLVEGGWVLFDDYGWSHDEYERLTGKTSSAGVPHASLAEDERSRPQIEAVFRLLVMQHPNYSEFLIVDNELAAARKARSATRTLQVTTRVSLRRRLIDGIKQVRRVLRP